MMAAAVFAAAVLCISLGSVSLPLKVTWQTLFDALWGRAAADGVASSILVHVRAPRVLAAGLSGAALALCGAAMQGLLPIRWRTAPRWGCPPALLWEQCWPWPLAFSCRACPMGA